MKKEHQLAIAGVLLVVILGFVYLRNKEADKQAKAHSVGHENAGAKQLPKIKLSKEEAAKVTKLVIKAKDKDEVTLEKKKDKWVLTKPLEASANQSNVDSVLKNLEKLELKAVVADEPDDKILSKYELDKDNAVHLQVFTGKEKTIDAFFGKGGGRGQMTRIAGKKPVYATKGFSSYNYARDLKNWRNTDILKFEDGNAISIEVENKNGKFSFTKNDDAWENAFYKRSDKGKLAKKAAKWKRYDAAKVKSMLGAYKNLKATDFAADGADTGFDAAVEHGGTVRIKLKDDKGDFKLTIGKKQEGSNRYLMKEGNATGYIVSSWAADWATADQEKFSKPEKKKGDDKDAKKGPPGMPSMPGMPPGMPRMPPMPPGR